jgi:gliding motility-associated lipoprotein GldH
MIKGTNKRLHILAGGLIMLLSSCNSNVLYTDSRPFENNYWGLDNIPDFSIPVSDTINSANVSFTIRTGSDYPFRNIYLFVTSSSPNGTTITDTVEYNLADEKGNWYGKGFGDIHELNLPYRSNVFFPAKGTYHFKIQHGMRIGDLKGVYDIGVRFEKSSR